VKKVMSLKGWGIFENNAKEISEYGFKYTVLTPDDMEIYYVCGPGATDIECETLEQAMSWVKNY